MFHITHTQEKLDLPNGSYWLCPEWVEATNATGINYDGRDVCRPATNNELDPGTSLQWICVAKSKVYKVGMYHENSVLAAKSIWDKFVNAPR